MTDGRRTVVTVQIAGEEYTIRTDATDEYTRECAAYVDRMIRQIFDSGGAMQPHKASVLAALAITDELFKARREGDALRESIAERAARMSSEISRRLEGSGLATRT